MKQSVTSAWTDHRTRTMALNGWLAREDAVAAGTARETDPQLLGLPAREELLRALFQRFTTTLEGVLDVQLELGEAGAHHAVRAAYRRAVAHRPADWRALVREREDEVVAELTRRQYARIARRAGLGAAEVARIAAEVARVDTASRARGRRRRFVRVLARRVG